jgi:hypothetical protein
MTKPYLTKQTLERAAMLREQGMSLSRIVADIGGGSTGALAWHFLKLGVESPKPRPLRLNFHLERTTFRRGKHIVRAFTPEDDAKLLDLLAKGLTRSAIARALGRKPNAITGRLMTLARRDERAAQ